MLSRSWNSIVLLHKVDVYQSQVCRLEFIFNYSTLCLNIFDFSFYLQYAQCNSFTIISLSRVQMQPVYTGKSPNLTILWSSSALYVLHFCSKQKHTCFICGVCLHLRFRILNLEAYTFTFTMIPTMYLLFRASVLGRLIKLVFHI